MFHEQFFQLKAMSLSWKGGRFNQNKLIAAHQMAFSPNQWISTSKSYQRQICRLKLARNTCDVHGKNLDKSSTWIKASSLGWWANPLAIAQGQLRPFFGNSPYSTTIWGWPTGSIQKNSITAKTGSFSEQASAHSWRIPCNLPGGQGQCWLEIIYRKWDPTGNFWNHGNLKGHQKIIPKN